MRRKGGLQLRRQPCGIAARRDPNQRFCCRFNRSFKPLKSRFAPFPDGKIEVFKLFDLNVADRLRQHRVVIGSPGNLLIKMAVNRSLDGLRAG